MQNTLIAIVQEAKEKALTIHQRPEFEAFKSKLVGPQGKLTECMKNMANIPPQDKPTVGKWINQAKQELEVLFNQKIQSISVQERLALVGPSIDPTLPCYSTPLASRHPLSLIKEELRAILKELGFYMAEGWEVESEWYCFDALNTPDDHPARDAQDTLYMDPSIQFGNISQKNKERYILRTQTSNVQIRKMLSSSPPIKIASLGRCFRRDAVDATHSANFHQLEVLYVDKNISLKDLKNMLEYFLEKLLGKNIETRLRPSFFPFTEPSYEVDVKLNNMGKLSGQWLEILGCGLVDPKVFANVGYDSQQWSGFAWGMGLERLAMIRYGIDDIRYFYQNDMRFLKQFAQNSL